MSKEIVVEVTGSETRTVKAESLPAALKSVRKELPKGRVAAVKEGKIHVSEVVNG